MSQTLVVICQSFVAAFFNPILVDTIGGLSAKRIQFAGCVVSNNYVCLDVCLVSNAKLSSLRLDHSKLSSIQRGLT